MNTHDWLPPAYIAALDIRGAPVDFKADMATFDLLFDQEVPLVDDWMDDAAERAKIAFAAATVEWIAWRLDGIDTHGALHELAQALWAAMVDIAYWRNFHHEQPTGRDALAWTVYTTWQETEAIMRASRKRKGKSGDVVDLVLIARHVLPKRAQPAFKKWLVAVLDKRVGVHWQLDDDPRDRALRLGPLVSREAFDPALPLDEAAMPAQVAALLRWIDWRNNRYLLSPDEMLAAGFSGTPYAL